MGAALEPDPEHARLLVAVADELMRVRRDVDGVEALLSDLVRHAPAQDRPAALIQAQALDALNQRLEALSGVLRRLGAGAGPAEAVSRLPLADLAGRLRPAADAASPSNAVDAGDLTLF